MPPTFRLTLQDLEPLAPPDPLDPFMVHGPPGVAQQSRQPAIAVATILLRPCDNVIAQRLLIVRPARHLGSLIDAAPAPADPSLGYRKLSSHMIDTAPSRRGVQMFPRAASCRSACPTSGPGSPGGAEDSPSPGPSSAIPGRFSDRHLPCASGNRFLADHDPPHAWAVDAPCDRTISTSRGSPMISSGLCFSMASRPFRGPVYQVSGPLSGGRQWRNRMWQSAFALGQFLSPMR